MTGTGARPAQTVSALHIPSLDGLRAISFCIVFCAHAGLQVLLQVPGGFGVTVFFFLSGYLITTLLRQERQVTGRVSIKHFYLRRVLRIIPPFYVVLGSAALLTLAGIVPGALRPQPLLAQAVHISNYWFIAHGADGAPAGTAPYWSLAVEEHFYLVFPVMYVLLSRRLSSRSQAMLLWTLCGVVLAWRCVLVFGVHVSTDRTYMGSDTRVDSILFGCALALGLNPLLDPPVGGRRFWNSVALPASLLVLIFSFVYRAPWFRESVRYTMQGLALTPVFIAAIRFPTSRPFRWLNTRPVAFLGALSYTMYLTHQIVIMTLSAWYPSLGTFALAGFAFTIALTLAYAVHVWIEKPCARLRRRLSAGRKDARPAQPDEPESRVEMAPGRA